MENLPSILIAEDDERTRLLLQAMLQSLGYPIAGQAADGREAVEKACMLDPGVLLLDIGMPVLDGLEAARLILERQLIPIVVLTGLTDEETLEEARRIGVQAFLLKPLASKEQLRSAIAIATTVCERQRADLARINKLTETLQTTRATTAPRSLTAYGLTGRETEVVHLLAEGRSNAEIGVELELSPRTVEKHVEHILQKLGVKSRAAATRLVSEAPRRRTKKS
jgi:DNA-binding NarL/FixJ family response regulator